jgi:5-methylcytosine-specific restriction enzyme subunit McrC
VTNHTLFEWERRRFDAANAIPVAAAEQLVRVGKAASDHLPGKPAVFDFGRDALAAKQVVGVVQADGVSCEILPKVDREVDPAATSELRRQLIHMLGVAYDLPVANGTPATLDTQGETLLEILIGLFARSLAEVVRRGMPRRYVGHEEDLSTLRGRLHINRQFTKLAVTPDRLACRFDALSSDITLNRIMKATITHLAAVSQSAVNQRSLRELAFTYADITAVPPRDLDWAVLIDRSNARWRQLLALAKLLLGGRYQTTSHGESQGFALLFEMNSLFERYVTLLLGRVAVAHGLELTAQGGQRPCLRSEGGDALFHTYPDIQLQTHGEVAMVVDTKWKRLEAVTAENANRGVSQADVYQMMAYAKLYQCPELVLLYPHHGGLGPGTVTARYSMLPGSGERLTVASLDLSSEPATVAGLVALMSLVGAGARAAA